MHVSHGLFVLLTLIYLAHSAVRTYPSNDVAERDITLSHTQLPQDAPHEYKFNEFQPSSDLNGSFRQPYFSFKILFCSKDGITEEFFHRHWKTVHADLTLSQVDFAVRIQRYTQFHQDEENRAKVQHLLTAVNGAMQLAPHDGIAEFHAKDYETFEKFILSVFADPIIVGDQQVFVNAGSPMYVMAGYENLIFGSGIRTSNGYDGILPEDHRFKYSGDD
ncbi:hypothetical protein N0V83_003037 [Neocucurbitaria cava]|uniref:EthD domain-containing protein n=1 Tax=Neocucurbitaria cava TaxID=798079 RepID=A0A9W9CP88_9PLEO|nr:hypothetical protein N0V83_003037 [Neocucurbitaria cava]